MGRQSGVLQVTGTIGDLSFYHDRLHGFLVRRKGGPSREKVANDPQFERTRENASEFGAASGAGRQIREGIRLHLHLKGDSTVTPRLTSLLTKHVIKLDTMHDRGKRRVDTALEHEEARKLLRGFAFHNGRPFDRTVKAKVVYDAANGTFQLAGLNPEADFQAPDAATHVRLQGMTGLFDFTADRLQASVTNALTIALTDAVQDVLLTPDTVPTGEGPALAVLGVVFMQERNGELYRLREGESFGIIH